MPRTRNQRGNQNQTPTENPEGRETTMVTTTVGKFSEMTEEQQQEAFRKYVQRQDTSKGRNIAKRLAVTALKAAHMPEYNQLLQDFSKKQGVSVPGAGEDSDEE